MTLYNTIAVYDNQTEDETVGSIVVIEDTYGA
jgi:hypothetical protein